MFKLTRTPPKNNKLNKVPASNNFSLVLLWQKIFGGRPPHLLLLAIPAAVACIMLVPLIYIVVRSGQAGLERWLKLIDTRIGLLLWNTMSLTVVVTFFAVILGVSLAWLIMRTDLPGRRYFQWLMAIPLLIPPYVGGMCYIIIFGPRGWVQEILGHSIIDIYGFWGAAFVLSVFTYPYVLLIVYSALKHLNMNFEETGLSLGLSYRQVFLRVVMPLLRPAIGAGAILVALYTLSDFGAISMMRYTTFTAAIYFQIGSFDRETASVLSTVLISLTLLFLFFEAKTKTKQKFYQTGGTYRKPRIIPLGRWKIPALCYLGLIFTVTVIVPLFVLIYWSSIGIMKGALNDKFWLFAWNSFYLSGTTSFICIFLAFPVVYLKSRYPSLVSKVLERIAYAGYVLPGVIVALGVIFIFNQYLPIFYNTIPMIVLAYFIKFFPKSLQSQDASLSLVSPRLDEAGRSLGHPPWKVMVKIILPLILPGVLAGGALVFVAVIKELSVTLLLRPPGMDTLAVRIWIEASEYFYDLAAPAALLIILISLLPLIWMISDVKEGD